LQKFISHLRGYVFAAFFLGLACSMAAQPVPQELFGGLKWRLIGPFRGGRAVAVAGVPGDSTTFYFGAVNGGIWKTTDGGVIWKPIFDSQPVGSIGAIAVAPSDSATIYVGTGESDIRSSLSFGNGVYKSVDAGRTWTHIGLEDTRHISRIVVDPQNPNIVYVGALGHVYGPNDQRGVYKSTDGGMHWTRVLDQGPEIGVSDLAICSGTPQLLFAGTWHTWRPPWSTYAPIDRPGGGLYRSQDSGKTWTRLNGSGLPEGDWGRVGVDVAPDGKRVYALISAKKAGLYRSDDGGNTWTDRLADSRIDFPRGEWGWKIQFLNSRVGFISLENFQGAAILKTVDGGQSWSRIEVRDPQANVDLEGIGFIDEHVGWVGGWGEKIAGGHKGTSSATTDGGATWRDANDIGRFINRFRFTGTKPVVGYASGATIYLVSRPDGRVRVDRLRADETTVLDALLTGGDAARQTHVPSFLALIHPHNQTGVSGRMVDWGVQKEKVRPHLRHGQGEAIDEQPHGHMGGMSTLSR